MQQIRAEEDMSTITLITNALITPFIWLGQKIQSAIHYCAPPASKALPNSPEMQNTPSKHMLLEFFDTLLQHHPNNSSHNEETAFATLERLNNAPGQAVGVRQTSQNSAKPSPVAS